MKLYQEMTATEKDTAFRDHCPVHHVFWVMLAAERVGYVYQIPVARAGRMWADTGATAAWCACHRLGPLGNGDHAYFSTKAIASAAIVRYERHLTGKVAS